MRLSTFSFCFSAAPPILRCGNFSRARRTEWAGPPKDKKKKEHGIPWFYKYGTPTGFGERSFSLGFFLILLSAATLQAQPAFKALVFSATAGFRHDSITNGIALIKTLGTNNIYSVDTTEDA